MMCRTGGGRDGGEEEERILRPRKGARKNQEQRDSVRETVSCSL